jgi:hypothetical protein
MRLIIALLMPTARVSDENFALPPNEVELQSGVTAKEVAVDGILFSRPGWPSIDEHARTTRTKLD